MNDENFQLHEIIKLKQGQTVHSSDAVENREKRETYIHKLEIAL